MGRRATRDQVLVGKSAGRLDLLLSDPCCALVLEHPHGDTQSEDAQAQEHHGDEL